MNNTNDFPEPARKAVELDLDAIRARVDAATEGPWVLGYRWHIAGTGFGRNDDDKCTYCARSEPVWSGIRDINGTRMQAHVHETPEPWSEDGIYSAADISSPTCVVVETDEYGGCSNADREFIAHARTDVPALLAEVERLRSDVAGMTHLAEWLRGARNRRRAERDAARAALADTVPASAVRELADEWEAAINRPMPKRADTETAEDQGVRIGVWNSVRLAASELRALLPEGDA